VLRAAEETETTQEHIQDWLELDEGDTGFQLLTEEEMAAMISFYLFSSALPISLQFSSICFLSLFLPFRAIFASLIRMTSPSQSTRISEGLL
jgi:hypothetical protein